MCGSYMHALLVGVLTVGAGPIPDALAGFSEPIPHIGMHNPPLKQGEELSFILN